MMQESFVFIYNGEDLCICLFVCLFYFILFSARAKLVGLEKATRHFLSRRVYYKNRFFAKDIAGAPIQNVDFWNYKLLVVLENLTTSKAPYFH